MKNKINQLLSYLLVAAILLANAALSYANSGMEEMESFVLINEESSSDESIAENIEPVFTAQEVENLNENVNSSEEEIEDFESVELVDSAEIENNEEISDFESSTVEFKDFEDGNEEIQTELTEEQKAQLENNEVFLDRLKEELSLSKSDYHQLLNSVTDTEEHLNHVKEERSTLEEQLGNLDGLIEDTSKKLITIIGQIVETENDISLLMEQIELREIALNYQKSLLKDYLRALYEEENNYYMMEGDGSVNAFKLLLSDENVSDHLKQMRYFDLLNETGLQILDKLDKIQYQLEEERKTLTAKKFKLDELEVKISTEKDQLELQKIAKSSLLELTKGQEEIYSQLLEQTIEEQGSVVEDIRTLNNAVAFIEKEIEVLGPEFDPTKYDDFLSDTRSQVVYDFHIRYRGMNPDGFDWPLEPIKGISAYYRDPGYVGVFGVQHSAIDIPAYQGTPVRAAADGVVYAAKDNGYGYSYIIILHADGYSTVYGHISQILVKEGDSLTQGQIIGLSGGLPGTKGAGYMTTGPHLHFEMLIDGKHVDPLPYMPLEVLTDEQAERLPAKYQTMRDEAIFGKNINDIPRYSEEGI